MKKMPLMSSLLAACLGLLELPGTAIAQPSAGLIQHGAYLAKAADCIACHTASGGQPFAGGLKMGTPIGDIYSSNITPDRAHGIGKYSYADFERAVRHGVTPSGQTLYPAMPYPSYARASDQDMQALYAYFMHGVPAVAQANKPVDIIWPLSMRWPLALWRKVFVADDQAPAVAPSDQQLLKRGAYLAESLGHCGACHTARSVTMEEQAMSNADPRFLAGAAPLDGWVASNLRGDHRDGLGSWSLGELMAFLRNGRNRHASAFGGMAEVVANSTQHLNDRDLLALATYLKSLAPTDPASKPQLADAAATLALRAGDLRQPGAQVYVNRCAGCHRSDGAGYARVFPALAGNPVVQSKDATSIMHLVLVGATVPATARSPSALTMPGFSASLSNQDVADVVNFVRNSWGNQAPRISASAVARERKKPYNQPPVVSSARR